MSKTLQVLVLFGFLWTWHMWAPIWFGPAQADNRSPSVSQQASPTQR